MESSTWLLLAIFLLLDLLFVAVRASYVHVRVPHLINLRDENHTGAERTLRLLERPFLPATLRVGVAVMHIQFGALMWFLVGPYLALIIPTPQVMVAVLFALTVLLLVLEFTLEGLILRDPERSAIRLSGFVTALDVILRPVTWLLMRLLGPTEALQRSLGSVTEDELRSWVEDGQPEGSLERDERKMIYSIFHFSDTLCREIMVPRVDMFAFDVTTSLSEAAQTALASGHSRVPVFDESIDNIIGLLYVKDLLRLLVEENHTITSLRDVIRPAYFVPEAKKVDELLNEMQARGVHMVVVVDEYGGTAGLVTLEDIVEEIVGEIRDEYDQAEEHPVQIIGPQEFVFHGRIDLEDVNELLGTHFTKDLADTLGGYIYAEFNRVPANGDTFEVEDWLLTIEQVNGRRIRRVRAVPKPIRATNEEKANDAER